tara:strand:+ start:6623 stop:7027 length:405 start_codon:yes stop_codon:yes gene_type:complete
MDFWIAAGLFFAGVASHKFISYCLNLGYGSVAYRKLEDAMLDMLMALDVDMRIALEKKYKHLEESGISPEEIKKRKLLDSEIIVKWRDAVIANVVVSLPESFYRYVNYTTWDEAVQYARKRNRKSKGRTEDGRN